MLIKAIKSFRHGVIDERCELHWLNQRRFSRSDWCLYLSYPPNNRSCSKGSSGRSQASRRASLSPSKEPRFSLSSFSETLLRSPTKAMPGSFIDWPSSKEDDKVDVCSILLDYLDDVAFFLWWRPSERSKESDRNVGIRGRNFPLRGGY